MSRSDEVKDKLLGPALASSDVAAIEKATEIWKSAAEAEQAEANVTKARIESAAFRFWIPALAPFLGALVLAVTVWIQFKQYNTNARDQLRAEREKEEENERAQLQTALETAKLPTGLSALTSVTLIKARLRSPIPEQQMEAREIAVSVLGAMSDPNAQSLLFPALFPKPEWSDFDDAVRLSRMLRRTWDDELAVLQNRKSELARIDRELAPSSLEPQPSPSRTVTPRERTLQSEVLQLQQTLRREGDPGRQKLEEDIDQIQGDISGFQPEAARVSDYMARCLRLPGRSATIDLSSTELINADFSNVDLERAELSGTDMISLDVKGAILTDISEFDGSDWSQTAWWRAKRISATLLHDLENRFPYQKQNRDSYFHDQTRNTDEYRTEIKRLEAAP